VNQALCQKEYGLDIQVHDFILSCLGKMIEGGRPARAGIVYEYIKPIFSLA
jgi:hypothetical protein